MMEFLDALDSVLYYPILLVVMGAAGLYFSVRMGFVQLRRLPEAIHLVMAKPADGSTTSPFQALMVSTAACVGTGNIIGVSTAICLGGTGGCVLDDLDGDYWGGFFLYGMHPSPDLQAAERGRFLLRGPGLLH